jgi:hypothetical protein
MRIRLDRVLVVDAEVTGAQLAQRYREQVVRGVTLVSSRAHYLCPESPP